MLDQNVNVLYIKALHQSVAMILEKISLRMIPLSDILLRYITQNKRTVVIVPSMIVIYNVINYNNIFIFQTANSRKLILYL